MLTTFDYIIAAIIVSCIFVGLKDGFIKSIQGFLSLVLSFVISKVCAVRFSKIIGEVFFGRLAEKILENRSGIFAEMEGVYQSLSDVFGEFSNSMARFFNLDLSPKDSIGTAINQSVEGIKSSIGYIVVFIVALIVSSIILNIIFSILDKIFKLPVLNFFNTLGGFFAGLLNAALVSVLFCFGVWAYLMLFAKGDSIAFLNGQINHSMLFSHIYKYVFIFIT